MNREFLQLAKNWEDQPIPGWFLSEKLDGTRCFWDGGVSRGLNPKAVPYANTSKDSRLKNERICTGLWTRYGHVISAPDWWLNQLPPYCLDGELWLGRGRFQELRSIVGTFTSASDWREVKYFVFDSPPWYAFMSSGRINNPNFRLIINVSDAIKLVGPSITPITFEFGNVYKHLSETMQETDVCRLHKQTQLSYNWKEADAEVREQLNLVCLENGEGLMLRHPYSFWGPKRTNQLLKVKKLLDAEATVIGYTWGKEGKLLGLMGALVVAFGNKRLELSGFTDAERQMTFQSGMPANSYGEAFPGNDVRSDVTNPLFPIGSIVTFKYRELTDDGIPKEARYWRKRDS